MKKIAVFFTEPKAMGYPLDKDEYWHSYQELDQEITQAGAEFYIVRSQATYQGGGIFSQSWKLHNGKLTATGQLKVDVIYDKGSFISDGKIPVFNNDKINEICTNKWLTYQLFTPDCPETILVKNDQELNIALQNIKTKQKVIKPIDGEEGKDVYIGDTKFIEKCPKKYPLLVQELIDSSSGIKGIVEGIHDFRIAIMNGEIVFSFIRTPPPKSWLANVARGGTQFNVDIDQIPDEAKKVVMRIDQEMSKHGDRFYGVDLAKSPSDYKIIELNSRLGLDENKRHPIFIELKKKLAKLLIKIAS